MAIFKKETLAQLNQAQASTARQYNVLVVDDKDSNLSVMSAILRNDYHVLEARDGQEALALIESLEDPESLACIVSDYRMPRLNGVELFEKAQLIAPKTSRIIVTGFIDIDAIVDSINRGGICKFIVKPFEASDLLDAVRSAVQSYESYQQLLSETHTLQTRNAELEKWLLDKKSIADSPSP
ncbi:MAG TPA: response regulator [Burkholderiaceae bacterium]|jgi:response regulator RpfG family c-di-GMP phosphodiesterase|nr:response regulator [Burkholderiaceae bacterium]